MPRSTSTSTKLGETPAAPRSQTKTWHQIRQDMQASYQGKAYTEHDLRVMEVKWRRIFVEAGFNVKGM